MKTNRGTNLRDRPTDQPNERTDTKRTCDQTKSSVACVNCSLPLGLELLRIRPVLRVSMQRIRGHNHMNASGELNPIDSARLVALAAISEKKEKKTDSTGPKLNLPLRLTTNLTHQAILPEGWRVEPQGLAQDHIQVPQVLHGLVAWYVLEMSREVVDEKESDESTDVWNPKI